MCVCKQIEKEKKENAINKMTNSYLCPKGYKLRTNT